MSAKTVRRTVFVRDPETNEEKWFYPGDKLPDWAAKVVTNPNVFKERGGATTSATLVAEEDPSNDSNIEFDDGNLMSLTHEQLDLLLEERDLSKSGDKPTKVARLEAYDASQS